MKFIYILFLSFLFQVGFSQNSNMKCGWYGKMPLQKRLNTFPFNNAKKVLLISFYPTQRVVNIIDKNGNIKEEVKDSIWKAKMESTSLKTFHIKEAEFDYYANEVYELNSKEINELSNLILNFKIKKKTSLLIEQIPGCYEPRNAILFLDENENVISRIEICFACNGIYQLPKETIKDFSLFPHIDICSEIFNHYKKIFRNGGIKYGIDEK
jgi:sporulation protein YlmC with PRC-barrel domain